MTNEIQVTIPYSQFEKMKQQIDDNSLKVTHYFVDEYPPITSRIEYVGKDDTIKNLIHIHEREINEQKAVIKELQEKLNKKHWWNKEKKCQTN